MSRIQRPRGMQDFIPPTSDIMEILVNRIADLFRSYGYRKIDTPILEHTELFMRLGETTDVVQKEMYTFMDRKGRSLTLRPELTAPVVRAYLELKEKPPLPVRYYYVGPIFRYERPQRGRYRQAHQFGIEVLGDDKPEIDLEVIYLAYRVYSELGLSELEVSVNSIGCPQCRHRFRDVLLKYLQPMREQLCNDCKVRIDKNPLRVLDCKVDRDKLSDAPRPIDYLCDECREHFQRLLELLNKAGIPYQIDHKLVRGLDYYNRTVFEIRTQINSRVLDLAGGGRYDYLASELEPKVNLPGCGFAGGLERLYMLLEESGKLPEAPEIFLLIAPLTPTAKDKVVELLNKLKPERSRPLTIHWSARSLKSALKYADRINALNVAFIGQPELEAKRLKVRDMRTGKQVELEFDELRTLLEGGSEL